MYLAYTVHTGCSVGSTHHYTADNTHHNQDQVANLPLSLFGNTFGLLCVLVDIWQGEITFSFSHRQSGMCSNCPCHNVIVTE